MELEKDENGFYYLNNDAVEEILQDNGFYISGDSEISKIKYEIYRLWQNQKKPLTKEMLDADTKADTNLAFKHFIFAEKYLKCSNITKVCKDLNISRPTAYEWLKRDDVQQYLQERQAEAKAEFKNINDSLYMNCITELNDIITGFNMNGDKIKAIDTYLKHYANMKRTNTGHADDDDKVILIDDVQE